jgi:hypothetical protein
MKRVLFLLTGLSLCLPIVSTQEDKIEKKDQQDQKIKTAQKKLVDFLKDICSTRKKCIDFIQRHSVIGIKDSVVIATYALLRYGIKKEEIKFALKMAEKRPGAVYEQVTVCRYAFNIMTLITADKEKYRDKIKRFCKKLIRLRSKGGAWGYRDWRGQNLAYPYTFFAVLALHMADSADDKLVPDRVWKGVLKRMKMLQADDGSWAYMGQSRGTQTAAGIAILMICSKHLNKQKSLEELASADKIKRGMEWIGEGFVVDRNPGAQGDPCHWLGYQFLFATGVAATLTKTRILSQDGDDDRQRDWYQEGVEYILERLDQEDEDWSDEKASGGYSNIILDTALMLLFLKKDFIIEF